MNCKKGITESISDKLELQLEQRSTGTSANAWLVQKGIDYLNSADPEAEVSYKYVIELLIRNDAADTIVQLARTAPYADTTVQWCQLYILGDLADKRTAKWLAKYSTEPLSKKGEGCEGPRDGELLLRTMAIESLTKIAKQNSNISEYILEIITANPEREVLIEAVKAGVELGLKEKIQEVLPKEDHWIINIRKARAEELYAEPERDDKAKNFNPPKILLEYNTPSTQCCCKKGGSKNG